MPHECTQLIAQALPSDAWSSSRTALLPAAVSVLSRGTCLLLVVMDRMMNWIVSLSITFAMVLLGQRRSLLQGLLQAD